MLVDKLFVSWNVRIVLENGEAVPVRGPGFYDLLDVLILIFLSWLGGMSFVYIFIKTGQRPSSQGLYVSSSGEEPGRGPETESGGRSMGEIALEILEGDERVLFQRVLEHDGILQRELVEQTGFSESKVSRLLDRLERRGLIVKQRFGMGNKVLLNRRF